MKHRDHGYLILLLLLLFGGCHSATSNQSSATKDLTKQDVFLEASFTPGFFGNPWSIRILVDGRVETEVKMSRKRAKQVHSQVTRQQLESLRNMIRDARFLDIAENHFSSFDDIQEFSLLVNIEGTEHRVRVWGPEESACALQVRRFLHVWNSVVEYVPPPGPCDSSSCKIVCQGSSLSD